MIENSFTWIDGLPGSGRTTLIERVLQSNRSKEVGVVRFRKNPRLRSPKEIRAGNEETRRYLSAGAKGALLIEYPDNDKTSVTDEFWLTGFPGNRYDAIYCEAELTDDQFPADLNIFVIPPLEVPSKIFEQNQVQMDETAMRALLTQAFSHVVPNLKKSSKSFDNHIDEVLAQESDKLNNLPPVTWLKLAPGFEGLILASTVVVNIRDESERPSAERLLEYIDKVGSGPDVIEPTCGYFWRPKKSLFICNLKDPKDTVLKKLVNKVKRMCVQRW